MPSRMPSLIPSAPDMAANQTNPQRIRCGGSAPHTFPALRQLRALHAPAYRTRRIAPLQQTIRVERVVAQNRQNPIDALVHPLQTNRTRRQLRVPGRRRVVPVIGPFDPRHPDRPADQLRLERIERQAVVSIVKLHGGRVGAER